MSTAFAEGTPAGPLRAIVEELVRAGVRDVVVCPGSRSTPLALALRADPALRVWVHLDERAGAFFALGAAKASRRPTAVLTTSGTAAANLMPAIVEARQGRVPLLAFTADRPPELRDRDAPQTIDQDHLFGRFAKWFAELPVPDETALQEAHVRGVIGRAVATAAASPAGPVHLDLPYREPLLPDGPLHVDESRSVAAFNGVVAGARLVPDAELVGLAARVSAARHGLIVCGPLDAPGFAEAVARLAAETGFPIVADALANVRVGPHDRSYVISCPEALLGSDSYRHGHAPDLVLRFGATPTSKATIEALRAWATPQIVVDDGGWAEMTHLPVTMVHADPVVFADALASRLAVSTQRRNGAWAAAWLEANAVAEGALGRWLASLDETFEGAIFATLSDVLPAGCIVMAGNSMPVRDLDTFLGSSRSAFRCIGNRGANGIDGLVSTALGAAAAQEEPVVAVVGDISFVHDLNALVAAARLGVSVTIIVVNNDGGGIFSFLPQASAERPDAGLPEHYEELFGTPHGLQLGPMVEAMGADHRLVESETLGAEVTASLAASGAQVLEVLTDRARNVQLHREVGSLMSAAVAEASGRGLKT